MPVRRRGSALGQLKSSAVELKARKLRDFGGSEMIFQLPSIAQSATLSFAAPEKRGRAGKSGKARRRVERASKSRQHLLLLPGHGAYG